MITEIRIENFKSIAALTLKPGRVTVLIGENGSGKSNILEAIAFAAGAAGNKLDREFLYSRGIRVTDYEWMRSAFCQKEGEKPENKIHLRFASSEAEQALDYSILPMLDPSDKSFFRWYAKMPVDQSDVLRWIGTAEVKKEVKEVMDGIQRQSAQKRPAGSTVVEKKVQRKVSLKRLREIFESAFAQGSAEGEKFSLMAPLAETCGLTQFLIYAPENGVLRKFDPEEAIEPLGSQGQGLLKLLQSFGSEQYRDRFEELKESLRTLGWFGDLSLPTPDDAMRDRIRITDTLLPAPNSVFDQRSANEGFLLLLFYFVLFLSWRTPKFFAIDNIDTALNPKLCAALMRQLTALAAKYDKQVIFTTHNPAVLDGLDLHDDTQRLFVVARNDDGETTVRRVTPPEPRPGERPIRLSEAFLRGLLGGLPQNF